jgi:hypothetical protein
VSPIEILVNLLTIRTRVFLDGHQSQKFFGTSMLGSQEAVGTCDPFELPDDFLMVEKVSQILPGALSMIYLYKARK